MVWLIWSIGAAAVVVAVASAIARTWISDDAYISFRYADNLRRGLGLVFNAGERVEGITNFLWTLFVYLGLCLGVSAERWTEVWGIAAYAGTILLLVRCARRRNVLPIAAVVAAFHVEWAVFATSGLETSAVTFLATAAYVCTVEDRAPWAGVLMGLAALTRPDVLLFVPILGVFIAATSGLRRGLVFALAFAVVWVPPTLWRIDYYGDFFPNTYYAKSASIPWWSQGFFYVRLYFQRYWALLFGLPLSALAIRRGDARAKKEIALELALALAFTLYVMRIGGDFMFGRMLIPATPFFAILLERGVAAGTPRPTVQGAAAAAAAAAIFLTPSPVHGARFRHGIANERSIYVDVFKHWTERTDHEAAILRRYFRGLNVRICFFGTEAQLVYKSRVPVAIECETGLTDAFIAHLPLHHRGRIGHEKRPPLSYLLDKRAVNFTFEPHWAAIRLHLGNTIPFVPIDLDGVRGRVLTWDAPVMAKLAERGARFPDVPASIDHYIAHMSSFSDAEVRTAYARMVRFYFEHVHDPARRAPFEARLSR